MKPPTSLPLSTTEVQFEVEKSSPGGLGSVTGRVAQWKEGALMTLQLEWPAPSPGRLTGDDGFLDFPDFRDDTYLGSAHLCAVSVRTATDVRGSVAGKDEADLRLVTASSVAALDSVT